MRKTPHHGFTIVEVMIAIAIVAILGAVALPAYTGYITRAKVPVGLDALSSVATRMEQYYQDRGNYGTSACGNGLSMPTPSEYFGQVTCSLSDSGQGFTASVSGASGGVLQGYTYTINHRSQRNTTAHPKGAKSGCWTIGGTKCDS